jgi:hypothetical protein
MTPIEDREERRPRWGVGLTLLLLAVLLPGCRRPKATEGTGAEAAARRYAEALLRQDWAGAHAVLHPDSRAWCGLEGFSRRGQNHRRGLGFEPRTVRLRRCEERGDEATARFAFAGAGGGRQRFFKEAVTLRRGPEGWGVVLSPRFGQGR